MSRTATQAREENAVDYALRQLNEHEAVVALNKLTPKIPGVWSRDEKAQFEHDFIDTVSESLREARQEGYLRCREAALKVLRESPEWKIEIDRAEAARSAASGIPRIVYEIGNVLGRIAGRI